MSNSSWHALREYPGVRALGARVVGHEAGLCGDFIMSSAILSGRREAVDSLTPLLFDELHKLAGRYLRDERRAQTLQPTALVNEAYLRLASWRNVEWRDKVQFLAAAATAMRRILVNHVLAKRAQKRGGTSTPMALDNVAAIFEERTTDLVALDEALEKLAILDPQQSRVVELRFFGGLTIEETARSLTISHATVEREWRLARAWLRRELDADR
jgi:RNA polymerase sigma factor (TIGR02999 family)